MEEGAGLGRELYVRKTVSALLTSSLIGACVEQRSWKDRLEADTVERGLLSANSVGLAEADKRANR